MVCAASPSKKTRRSLHDEVTTGFEGVNRFPVNGPGIGRQAVRGNQRPDFLVAFEEVTIFMLENAELKARHRAAGPTPGKGRPLRIHDGAIFRHLRNVAVGIVVDEIDDQIVDLRESEIDL